MCYHNEVMIYGYRFMRQTQLSPSEYVEVIECCDCGAELDSHQIPFTAIIHDCRESEDGPEYDDSKDYSGR